MRSSWCRCAACGVSVAQHGVDLRAGFRQDPRMGKQEIDCEGQQATRRLVAGDQERHHLVADVLVAEALAGLAVEPVSMMSSRSALAPRSLRAAGAALGDQVSARLCMKRTVRIEVRRVRSMVRERRLDGGRGPGLVEGCDHRADERMHLVLVETVEAVVERAQRDRVEREPRHVVGHVDRGAAEALPACNSICSAISSMRSNMPRTPTGPNAGISSAMRAGPVRLVVIGGEQAVAGEGTELLQRRCTASRNASRRRARRPAHAN